MSGPVWQPRILVTGPENSGTGAVATVLREAGAEVIHRAIPHVHDWFSWELEENIYRAVVVIRGLYAHTLSLKDHSGALRKSGRTPMAHRARCIEVAAELPHTWSPLWVTYESLVEPAEVRFLCEQLRLDPDRVTSVIEPRNRERYSAA